MRARGDAVIRKSHLERVRARRRISWRACAPQGRCRPRSSRWRARELATRTDATLLLPVHSELEVSLHGSRRWRSHPVGVRSSQHTHTRHTDESTSFVLNDAAAVFTGDTLFTNGVGRPISTRTRKRRAPRAHALFHSLLRLRGLPPTTLVLPAHASEPIAFDGQPIAASPGDVASWLSAWLASESGFVERVTSSSPTPPNFVRIVELNESGDVPDIDPTDLEAGANRCAVR